ncbi:MAG: copper chaperone PCu(A)C [Methylotenera sp.]|nr:copper chaperone PCu(A)C [Methylotenera sp.]MSP99407.1 copper chaperone PCu(A)C [Methylotenera sp.]
MKSLSSPNLNYYALFLLLCLSAFSVQVLALASSKELVLIQDAWVRPSSPGQDVGAAYMTFLSRQDVMLISIESDVTNSIEIHNMSMENGVMKMRMLETLALKAGKPYQLSPGGFHLMLFDLKKPLNAGEQVKFVLTFKKKNKAFFKQNVSAMVQAAY